MYTTKQKQVILTQLEFITDGELHTMYDDYLDEINEMVRVGELFYLPSQTLKKVDRTAYNCGFSDWLDNMITDNVISDEIEGYHYKQDEVNDIIDNIEEEEV